MTECLPSSQSRVFISENHRIQSRGYRNTERRRRFAAATQTCLCISNAAGFSLDQVYPSTLSGLTNHENTPPCVFVHLAAAAEPRCRRFRMEPGGATESDKDFRGHGSRGIRCRTLAI